MNNEKIKQYLNTDSPRWTSIYAGQEKRYKKANEECNKKNIIPTIENIIDYVLEFFCDCEIKSIEYSGNNKYKIFRPIDENTDLDAFNKCLKSKYGVNDNSDILWMKFTEDGYLGVVAISNDINFETASALDPEVIPNLKKETWKFSASATLISYVGKQWDKTSTLVFPLLGLKSSVERHRIETAVGNYLSEKKGVPIIDFYSHRLNTKLKKNELQ